MTYIDYEKIDISDERLASLHRDMEKATKEQKYGRFKAWLHYANLKRWRNQGLHFWYLSGPDSKHCTCGLIIGLEGTQEAEKLGYTEIGGLKLDKVHIYRGHRNLPSGRGITVALITSFEYREDLKDYLWNVFCQECGEVSLKMFLLEAKEVVKEHNKRCKTFKRS